MNFVRKVSAILAGILLLAMIAVAVGRLVPFDTPPSYGGKPLSHWQELASHKNAEAIPALRTALRDKNAQVRFAGATSLAYIGQEAQEAVPDLIGLLQDEDADVRFASAFALANIGPQGERIVPALTAASQDNDERVRQWAKATLEVVIFRNEFQRYLTGLALSSVASGTCPCGMSPLFTVSTFWGWAGVLQRFFQRRDRQ